MTGVAVTGTARELTEKITGKVAGKIAREIIATPTLVRGTEDEAGQ